MCLYFCNIRFGCLVKLYLCTNVILHNKINGGYAEKDISKHSKGANSLYYYKTFT